MFLWMILSINIPQQMGIWRPSFLFNLFDIIHSLYLYYYNGKSEVVTGVVRISLHYSHVQSTCRALVVINFWCLKPVVGPLSPSPVPPTSSESNRVTQVWKSEKPRTYNVKCMSKAMCAFISKIPSTFE